MRTRVKGLTLIEVMVVILIISVLLVIAFPNWMTVRENARLRACAANMKKIETALEQYAIDHRLSGYDPLPNVDQLFLDGYFKTLPICPSGGNYTIEGNITSYEIKCDEHGKLTDLAGNL
ncbi:prepilin-type N-terminal cleavage/methylation domain-containing protein [bacterium]|nr:prepilin-type N-terminal cleavage/methylation domain-containing protein [bacterium]